MKKHFADFIHKTITSRKFWAAVAASAPFAAGGDWNSFAYVWMGYAGIQGAVDATERVGSAKEKLRVGPVEMDPDMIAAAVEAALAAKAPSEVDTDPAA